MAATDPYAEFGTSESRSTSVLDNVRSENLAYVEMKKAWPLIDALCGGTMAMRDAGKTWLPQRMKEPDPFYAVRLSSSVLYNALKDTVDAIVAKPFSQDVSVGGGLPVQLADIADDVDGAGTSMQAFAADVFRVAWKYGLCHVFVDYPTRRGVEEVLLTKGPRAFDVPTPESNASESARPVFIVVTPAQMIAWRHERRGTEQVLVEARWTECVVEQRGAWGEEEVEQVRVLREATWEVWRQDEHGTWLKVDEGVNSLGVVPVVTYYVERTGMMTGCPPLLDLAWLNLAHWQSSSIQRNALDVARIPILVKLGFDEDSNKDGTVVGTGVFFQARDVNAKAFYCESTGGAIPAGERDLADLRRAMESLGLSPWMQQTSASTATGVAANDEKAECRVQTSVRALERALVECYRLAAQWARVTLAEDFEVDVFDDFGIAPDRAQDIDALIRMRQAKMITSETVLTEFKRRKVLGEDVDVKLEVEALAQEGPSLGEMFGGGNPFGGGADNTPAPGPEGDGTQPPPAKPMTEQRVPRPRFAG